MTDCLRKNKRRMYFPNEVASLEDNTADRSRKCEKWYSEEGQGKIRNVYLAYTHRKGKHAVSCTTLLLTNSIIAWIF